MKCSADLGLSHDADVLQHAERIARASRVTAEKEVPICKCWLRYS